MKKLLSLLLCLCLTLGAVAALAEPDPLVRAYQQNLTEHIRGIDLREQGLTLEIPNLAVVTLQQEEDVLELTADVGNGHPVTVQAGAEGLWLSMDGRVTLVPTEAITQLIADAMATSNPLFALLGSDADLQTMTEMRQVALQKIVLPFIQSESTADGGTVLKLHMTGEDFAEAVAECAETVAAEPRYCAVIARVINGQNKLNNMVLVANGYPANPETTAEDIAAEALQLAQRARANAPDFTLEAEVTLGGEKTLFTAAVTSGGKTVRFEGDASASGVNLRAFDEEQTYMTLTAAWALTDGVRSLSAKLELPGNEETLTLKGRLSANSLNADLTYDQRGRTTRGTLRAMWVDGEVVASLDVKQNTMTVFTADLHSVDGTLSLTAQSQAFLLDAEAAWDETGALASAAFALRGRMINGIHDIRGIFDGSTLVIEDRNNKLTATLTGISENEMEVKISVEDGSAQPTALTVRSLIADTADGWTLTTLLNGAPILRLTVGPKHPQTPLKGLETAVLTEQDLVTLIVTGQLPAEQTAPDAPDTPSVEDRTPGGDTGTDVFGFPTDEGGNDLTAPAARTVTIAEGGQKAYFTFTPAASGVYTLASEGDLDPYAAIYEGETFLATNDDGGNRFNFSLTRELTEGVTYTYEVAFYDTGMTGTFGITLNAE